MKRLIYIILSLATIIITVVSCTKDKDYIRLVNRSNQDIYVFHTYDDPEILPQRQAELGNIINRYYQKGTYKSYTAYFDIDIDLCDTLYVTVISADTLKKYSWETVYNEKMIMQRYIVPFTKEYLRSIDYTLKYYGPEKLASL